MNLIISDAPPTLVVSYDPIRRAIQAHFAKPLGRDLTYQEEQAMLIIKEEFEKQTSSLASCAVDQKLIYEVKSICSSAINYAHHQTGVKFELDTQHLVIPSTYKW